ncbi:MAG: hypothetical protein M5U31_15605, partial [Acidimicrobiia bacterium]|nr:hypothetical protein [Acidimicrobiia bacterium]
LPGAVSGVSLNILWGADDANPTSGGGLGDRSVAFTNANVAVSGAYNGASLTSLGQAVSYAVLGTGELVGYTGALPGSTADANVVFFVSLSDANNGEYSFTLVKPLDHADDGGENTLSLTFNYTATDSDGDTASNTFTVDVVDDVALIGTPQNGTVEEEQLVVEGDGLEDGTPNPQDADFGISFNQTTQRATGTLAVAWGSDDANDNDGQPGDRSIAFVGTMEADLAALNLTSRGDALSYTRIAVTGGEVLLAYTGAVPVAVPANAGQALAAEVVFAVALSDAGNGSYTFTLYSTLDHPGPVQGEDTLTLNFGFVATDSDGDTTAPGTFSVGVIDDQLLAIGTIAARYVEEEELPGGNEDDVPGGLTPDADGNYPFVGHLNLTTAQAGGPLLILWGGDDSNTAVDGGFDGTQAPGDRSVVFDVASPAGGTRVLTAAEIDGFVTMSGGLFASALTSEGRALVYELSADNTVLTAKAGSDVIFTVTLSDQGTGSFQFVLSGVLDHPVAATGASNEDVMGFTFRFAARDGDGDVATND